jgi:copper homeostasis protein
VSASPLSLVFDNCLPGVSRTGSAVTAVVNPDWAAEHWGLPDEEVARRLVPLVSSWVGRELLWHRVRRWDHGRAVERVRMPFAEVSDLPPMVIAGDAFARYVAHPLDAAYTSAVYAVNHLCRALGRVGREEGVRMPRTPSRTAIEVAVSTASEATLALRNGADRLLLLTAPEVGGLTPSLDTYLAVRRVAAAGNDGKPAPVTVLLRPRLGDCEYDRAELAQIRADARRFLLVGADAIAFGAVMSRGGETRVDADGCRTLVALAQDRGKKAVFHRAFDRIHDRRTGLQDLIDLGFSGVYTGGRWRLAADGTSDLAADVSYAGWDIDVVAAGGIGPGTAGYVIASTGCPGVLLGLRRASGSILPRPRRAFESHRHLAPDADRLRDTIAEIRQRERARSSIESRNAEMEVGDESYYPGSARCSV